MPPSPTLQQYLVYSTLILGVFAVPSMCLIIWFVITGFVETSSLLVSHLLLLKDTGMCVRLDVFHAMKRLSKLVLNSLGACSSYLTRLRDAFYGEYRRPRGGRGGPPPQRHAPRRGWPKKKNAIGLISLRDAEGRLHRGAVWSTHRMWLSVSFVFFW